MALIRRADTGQLAHDAIALDLGDLADEGEAIKHAARVEAQRIIDEANATRDRLIASAHSDGLAQGRAEGIERGRADGAARALAESRDQLERLDRAWTEAAERFERDRVAMLVEARRDVLELALRIAQRITHRAIELSPEIVADQLEAVLAALARPTRLTIAIHPDDEPIVRQALPGLVARCAHAEHVEVAVDPSLGRGSCVAQTAGGGIIDAAIDTQLDRIARELLPDPQAGPREAAA